MKVLFVASEVNPFAKSGGLADVAGALPAELNALGMDVRVVLPKYKSIDPEQYSLVPLLDDISVKIGYRIFNAKVYEGVLPGTDVPVYFIENPYLFDRNGFYNEGGREYSDNHIRFAFFSKAVIWLMKGLNWIADIVHCNDWQTALVPIYLRTQPEMKSDPELASIKTVYTIHNLAYQGHFHRLQGEEIEINWELFNSEQLEFYGGINLMKGGIVFADFVTTVSERYGREIQNGEFAYGLEGVIQAKGDRFRGILNGVDYREWNPFTDVHLPANYQPNDLTGKQLCKAALAQEMGFSDDNLPLAGVVSRFDTQKGFDILIEALPRIMENSVRFIILGSGSQDIENRLRYEAEKYGDRLILRVGFDVPLAHRIIAGSDIFLMPSLFEPCGLNQFYSMKYGTLPLVRETGGLADSVIAHTEKEQGYGFLFSEYSPDALAQCLEEALLVYQNYLSWKPLQLRGMAQDFSWKRSATGYRDIYLSL